MSTRQDLLNSLETSLGLISIPGKTITISVAGTSAVQELDLPAITYDLQAQNYTPGKDDFLATVSPRIVVLGETLDQRETLVSGVLANVNLKIRSISSENSIEGSKPVFGAALEYESEDLSYPLTGSLAQDFVNTLNESTGDITLASSSSNITVTTAGSNITLSGGGVEDHGALTGLGDDDHTQYSLVDGTRPFTGTVGGITPTISSHLATKGYVDDNNLSGPEWLRIEEDFVGGGLTSATLGNLGWTTTASLTSLQGEANHPGIVRFIRNNGYGGICCDNTGTGGAQEDLIASSLSEFVWIFRPGSLVTDMEMFCGLVNASINANTIPNHQVTFRYNSATSANWRATLVGAGTSDVDTGVAATALTWYNFRVVYNGASFLYYINGNLVATIDDANIPTNELKFCLGIRSAVAEDRRVEIDYAKLVYGPLTR